MEPLTRLAIIKFGALGDVVRTTALLRPLHRKYQPCEITWFTSASAAPLLARNSLIKEVVIVKSLENSIPAGSFDWVLSLDEEPIALNLASRIATRHRFGAYSDGARTRYTPSSKAWFDMSLLNRDPDGKLTTANKLKEANKLTHPQLFCQMLEAPPDAKHPAEPVLVPDPNEESFALEFMKQQHVTEEDFVVGLNTSAGMRWPNKQMSIEKSLALIEALGEVPKIRMMILGGPDEEERNRTIASKSSVPLIDPGVRNALPRFISLLNRCQALVTSDSLALHVATALKKPIVAFFGPTSRTEIDFYGRGFAWLPPKPCQCFYLTSCKAPAFCLETLDFKAVLTFIEKSMAERDSAAAAS